MKLDPSFRDQAPDESWLGPKPPGYLIHIKQRTDSKAILGSLFRSVAHTLLSTGRFQPAVQLVNRAAGQDRL